MLGEDYQVYRESNRRLRLNWQFNHFWLIRSITTTQKTVIEYDRRFRLPHVCFESNQINPVYNCNNPYPSTYVSTIPAAWPPLKNTW